MISPKFSLSGSDARGLLYGLLEVDKIQLREDPSLPSIRRLIEEGKVVYEQSDPDEHWQSYREMVDQVNRYGVARADCEDLAPAVAAEDQIRYGIESVPFAYSPRPSLFHVVTAVPSTMFGSLARSNPSSASWPRPMRAPDVSGYTLQDPSARAGMETFGGLGKAHIKSSHPSFGAIGFEDFDPVLPTGHHLGRISRSIASIGLPFDDEEEDAIAEAVLLEMGTEEDVEIYPNPDSFGAVMREIAREDSKNRRVDVVERRRLRAAERRRRARPASIEDVVQYGSVGFSESTGWVPPTSIPERVVDRFGEDLLTDDDLADVLVGLIESKL